jgi:hypothetical protein
MSIKIALIVFMLTCFGIVLTVEMNYHSKIHAEDHSKCFYCNDRGKTSNLLLTNINSASLIVDSSDQISQRFFGSITPKKDHLYSFTPSYQTDHPPRV